MPINAVIFDMDGLMLDSEPIYRVAWQEASGECGYIMSDALHARLIGRRREDAEQVLVDEFGPDFPVDRFRTACRKCEATAFSDPIPRKAGLDELLALVDLHNMPKAVATSTERALAIPRLMSAGLMDSFSVIATGDEVANGKPAPDLFLLAASRLGVDPAACLVLEDAEPGVIAAHRAGMQVYFVPDINPPSAIVESTANGIFDSLAEVSRHLESIISR